MVVNLGALKSKDYGTVFEDIKQVVEASAPYPVKVILETSSLNDEEKVVACALSKQRELLLLKLQLVLVEAEQPSMILN